jgi:hypothetical protein
MPYHVNNMVMQHDLLRVCFFPLVIVTPSLEKVTECILYMRQDQVPHISRRHKRISEIIN